MCYLTHLKHIPIFVEDGNIFTPLLTLPVIRKHVLYYSIYKEPLFLHIADLDLPIELPPTINTLSFSSL